MLGRSGSYIFHHRLVEADVGDVGQVDAAVGGTTDVEGVVVCDHLGEDIQYRL